MAAAVFAAPAMAQDGGEPIQTRESAAPGQTYRASEHGDWEVRCVRTEAETDPCQMYQLMTDENGNAVAEVTLFKLPAGQQAVAGATFITPLETLLTAQLTYAIDDRPAKRYPFTWCAVNGCYARVGFTAEEIEAMQRGMKGIVMVVPVQAPDQRVTVDLSLTGFTAAYDAIVPFQQ
jgi:invasion protein IalB